MADDLDMSIVIVSLLSFQNSTLKVDTINIQRKADESTKKINMWQTNARQ